MRIVAISAFGQERTPCFIRARARTTAGATASIRNACRDQVFENARDNPRGRFAWTIAEGPGKLVTLMDRRFAPAGEQTKSLHAHA